MTMAMAAIVMIVANADMNAGSEATNVRAHANVGTRRGRS